MRNNSGALTDKGGRLVRYGLGNVSKKHNENMKSSDLVGFTEVLITPNMLGKTVAVLTAIEVKAEGWTYKATKRERAQNNFIEWIKAKHGIAGFAQSTSDVEDIIENFKKEMKS